MQKAKVLIIVLIFALLFQLSYFLYINYKNKRTIDTVLQDGDSNRFEIVSFEVEAIPPTGNYTIADFENPEEHLTIYAISGDAGFSEEYPFSGRFSYKFEYDLEQTYPRLEIHYMPRNWNYYSKLEMMVFNPTVEKLPMIIRIDDHLSDWHTESYYASSENLDTGYNRLEYDIEQIGKNIDLKDPFRIVISIAKPTIPGTIYVDDIILYH
ncbi:MAG: hypothetical protein GY855_16000 [candidate division Zixibacteria bacterium]|nr:hypothetical protein [candidate division Zixibacteria bacterium]